MARSKQTARAIARLNAIPPAVREAAERAVEKSAEEMADLMRANVPLDEGALRDSISVTTGGNTTPAYSQPGGSTVVPEGGAMITVGSVGVRYPHLVEYGTVTTDAQPFFWPSIRLLSTRTKRRLKREITKATKDAVKP